MPASLEGCVLLIDGLLESLPGIMEDAMFALRNVIKYGNVITSRPTKSVGYRGYFNLRSLALESNSLRHRLDSGRHGRPLR